MSSRSRNLLLDTLGAIAVLLCAAGVATGQGDRLSASERGAKPGEEMTTHASGPFEVKLAPLDPYNQTTDAGLSRLSIDKQFFGDLEATSKGEMLSAGAPAEGSAGYVAIERVTGTLHGRSGSFALQHSSTMDAGASEQSILVTPGSGTGELTGLAGTMRIVIEDGAHSYELDYTLPRDL